MSRILIIDDDRALCRSLQIQLGEEGHDTRIANRGDEGFQLASEWVPDLVFLDLMLPDCSGLDVLKTLVETLPGVPVVMITGVQDTKSTVAAMRFGAFDYVRKPIGQDDVLLAVEKAKRYQRIVSASGADPVLDHAPTGGDEIAQGEIIGEDPKIVEVVKQIGLLSRSDFTVLITGESGTGKELVARALHEASSADQPFVAINCSSIVSTLPESELFGHERGAFTGAEKRKIGKLEYAGKGTVFLDEIGDMALDLQAKVLRVLQEREFERVGGLESFPFRARVIAATNRDLEGMVASERFREDLYYRLAVSTIHVPPLRERRDDIPLLVHHMLQRLGQRVHRRIDSVDERAMLMLTDYDWPGNIRELENVLTRGMALARTPILEAEDLSFSLDAGRTGVSARPPAAASGDEDLSLRAAERKQIGKVLEMTEWNITRAAQLLDISPTTLRKKISDYSMRE